MELERGHATANTSKMQDISEIWSCVSDATDRGIMNGSVVLLSSLTTSWYSACFRTVVRAFVQKFSS